MKSLPLVIIAAFLVILANASPAHEKRCKYAIQLKSNTEFCSFLPPQPGDNVSATENEGIPFCTSSDLGGKVFPKGFIKSAHYAETPDYVQVTGRIDRTKYKLKKSDGGGQYDNMDIQLATCNGYDHFVNLVEPNANIFCIRCCKDASDCNLGISTYGCEKIVPGNYS